MKDDILKFRKICDVLMKEQKYTQGKLCAEMGVSDPTILKLLKGELAEFKIRASVLGIVQDFNKKHCDDLKYAGVNSDAAVHEKVKKALKKTGEAIVKEVINKELLSIAPEDLPGYDSVEGINTERKIVKEPEIVQHQESSFTDLLIELAKSLPANVTIQISINGGEK